MHDFLAHPFHDPFFAAIATSRGIAMGDLPVRYRLGEPWGNEAGSGDLPGMTDFTFRAGGRRGWFGVMAIYLDRFDYRRETRDMADVMLGTRLPETIEAALAGRACRTVVDAPVIGDWKILSAGAHRDDDSCTTIQLEVPRA